MIKNCNLQQSFMGTIYVAISFLLIGDRKCESSPVTNQKGISMCVLAGCHHILVKAALLEEDKSESRSVLKILFFLWQITAIRTKSRNKKQACPGDGAQTATLKCVSVQIFIVCSDSSANLFGWFCVFVIIAVWCREIIAGGCYCWPSLIKEQILTISDIKQEGLISPLASKNEL